jgi:NAD(P)H-dependent FMN reductase
MRPGSEVAAPARPKVVALCGSLRVGSYTRMALQLAIDGASKAGGDIEVFDLGQTRLPFFDGGPAKEIPEAARFRSLVKEADGLLIATPVYHDSYSGVLKNALDLLYEELNEKVAALIAVGGGRVGQGQALEHLRAVFRETSCWVVPRQVAVPRSEESFDEKGQPKDKEMETRLTALGMELVMRCKQLRPRRRAS